MRMNRVIREYLKEHGIRLTFLSERTQIDIKKLSRIMLSKQRMTTEEYEIICEKGLNVSPAYFYKNKFLKSSNSA